MNGVRIIYLYQILPPCVVSCRNIHHLFLRGQRRFGGVACNLARDDGAYGARSFCSAIIYYGPGCRSITCHLVLGT